MNKKDIAVSFLRLASSGRVREAYDQYVSPNFRHHNPYFQGDRESLLKGMEENAREFPDKTYKAMHALEDGDLIAVHGKVKLTPDSQWSVIHIFRFEGDTIIESWEASQQVLKDSPNQNGMF